MVELGLCLLDWFAFCSLRLGWQWRMGWSRHVGRSWWPWWWPRWSWRMGSMGNQGQRCQLRFMDYMDCWLGPLLYLDRYLVWLQYNNRLTLSCHSHNHCHDWWIDPGHHRHYVWHSSRASCLDQQKLRQCRSFAARRRGLRSSRCGHLCDDACVVNGSWDWEA